MAAISLRAVPISEQRKANILSELTREFLARAIGRKILRTVVLEQDSTRAARGEFRKIGLNYIVDKVWFVDDPPGEFGHYATAGIGTSYAIGLAEAETRAVVLKLLEATQAQEEEIVYRGRLDPGALERGVQLLRSRGFVPNSVLTNVSDYSGVWYFPHFASGIVPDLRLRVREHEIPVYDSREDLMERHTFVVDRDRAGAIVVKKELSGDIREIREDEEERIVQELHIPREELDRKARIYVDEVFRVDIDEPRAIVRMRRVD